MEDTPKKIRLKSLIKQLKRIEYIEGKNVRWDRKIIYEKNIKQS
jgi:hypothetical protein